MISLFLALIQLLETNRNQNLSYHHVSVIDHAIFFILLTVGALHLLLNALYFRVQQSLCKSCPSSVCSVIHYQTVTSGSSPTYEMKEFY
jgi:hypothetical protein